MSRRLLKRLPSELKLNEGQVKGLPKNPRFIRDAKFERLVESLKDFPEMLEVRPVVVNMEDVVLAGNMRLRAARELEFKKVPTIQVDLPLEKQKEFLIKDNVAYGEWDWEMLGNEWELELLESWGLDLVNEPGEEEDETYTAKIESPVYSPKNTKPEIAELYDTDKSADLLEEIEGADVDEEFKEFLRLAARRHVVFDFQNIAEYYAHATKEEQKLMERSALVIIDFNDAVAGGYVRLTEHIEKTYLEDYPDEDAG